MNKDYLNEKWLEMKPKIVVLACLVGAFISGYFTGTTAYSKPTPRQLNYTTNNTNKLSQPAEQKVNKPAGQGSACPVKGSSSRVYHLPGGAFYDRTNAAVCFNTEAEAVAAGYRKSSR